MASKSALSPLVLGLTRPPTSTAFVCRPCQDRLRSQFRYQPSRPRSQSSPLQFHPQPRPQFQTRSLHRHVKASAVPSPTPFVPDVNTFLTLIGRKLSTHSSKFTTWNDLFTLSSPQLKELGIEPARTRRYLLRWREKFRKGEYGIGGDFQHVTDGTGELRVVEVPALPKEMKARPTASTPTIDEGKSTDSATDTTAASTLQTPGMQKLIVNVPTGSPSYRLEPGQTTKDLKKPAYVTLRDGHVIAGSYLLPVAGSNGSVARLKVAEGLWEDKRGRKVFGGERRRAETLHKMRVAERKKNAR